MWHAWGRGEVFTGFWLDNIKLDLREIGTDEQTGFGWLRIGSSGGLL
jgi:hypothetical protein